MNPGGIVIHEMQGTDVGQVLNQDMFMIYGQEETIQPNGAGKEDRIFAAYPHELPPRPE
jgi:hypothetical protein